MSPSTAVDEVVRQLPTNYCFHPCTGHLTLRLTPLLRVIAPLYDPLLLFFFTLRNRKFTVRLFSTITFNLNIIVFRHILAFSLMSLSLTVGPFFRSEKGNATLVIYRPCVHVVSNGSMHVCFSAWLESLSWNDRNLGFLQLKSSNEQMA